MKVALLPENPNTPGKRSPAGAQTLRDTAHGLATSVERLVGTIRAIGEQVKNAHGTTLFGKILAFLNLEIARAPRSLAQEALDPRHIEEMARMTSWRDFGKIIKLYGLIQQDRGKMEFLAEYLQTVTPIIESGLNNLVISADGTILGSSTKTCDVIALYLEKPRRILLAVAQATAKSCERFAAGQFPDPTVAKIHVETLQVLQNVYLLEKILHTSHKGASEETLREEDITEKQEPNTPREHSA